MQIIVVKHYCFKAKMNQFNQVDIVMVSMHEKEVPAMVVQVSHKIKKTNIEPEFILRKAGFFEKINYPRMFAIE